MKSSQFNFRRRIAGVTLIELMLVVVVVAILGTLATASYQRYMMRAQRTEAKSELLRAAANQERFYLQNNTFTNDLTALGFGAADNAPTENGRYTLSVTAANAQAFTIQATAANQMLNDDDCQTFTITSQGARTAAPNPDGSCW